MDAPDQKVRLRELWSRNARKTSFSIANRQSATPLRACSRKSESQIGCDIDAAVASAQNHRPHVSRVPPSFHFGATSRVRGQSACGSPRKTSSRGRPCKVSRFPLIKSSNCNLLEDVFAGCGQKKQAGSDQTVTGRFRNRFQIEKGGLPDIQYRCAVVPNTVLKHGGGGDL